ncbi:MAG: SoxR reducing system RseC family protein [Thermodesulfobacteriota bacterium]
MAQTIGKVIGIERNGWARVITERTGTCSSCQTTQNCHSCLTHAQIETRAVNAAGARVGDLVTVSIKTETLLKSAAVLYLVPVLGLLAGALFGPVVGKPLCLSETVASPLFGFVGFSLGFVLVFFYSRKMSVQNRLSPIIVQVIGALHKVAIIPETADHNPKNEFCRLGNN